MCVCLESSNAAIPQRSWQSPQSLRLRNGAAFLAIQERGLINSEHYLTRPIADVQAVSV